MAPRFAVIAILGPLLLLTIKVRPTAAHWIGAAVVCYAALSLLWTPSIWDGLQGLSFLLMLSVAFCIGSQTDNPEPIYKAFALGIAVSCVLAIGQKLFGYSPVEQLIAPSGLFGNKNLMGEAAAATAVLMAFTSWWLLIPCLVALVLSSAKGAMLGVTVAGIGWLWPRYRKSSIVLAVLIITSGIIFAFLPAAFSDIHVRKAIWLDAWHGLSIFGNGIGSFHQLGSLGGHQSALLILPDHVHNDLLEVLFDLGIPGVVGVLVVCALSLRGFERERLALLSLFTASLFGFPFYCPATLFLAGIVAGRACGFRHRLWLGMDVGRDHRRPRPAARQDHRGLRQTEKSRGNLPPEFQPETAGRIRGH